MNKRREKNREKSIIKMLTAGAAAGKWNFFSSKSCYVGDSEWQWKK